MSKTIDSVEALRKSFKEIRQKPISQEQINKINSIYDQDEKLEKENQQKENDQRKIARSPEAEI